VAELPLPMQVKLLRAIQEKSVRPVGAAGEVPVDVRILSATHKDLSGLVTDGRFRHDLYYRINVIELRVPPLRERTGDLPQLANAILQRLSAGQGRPAPELTAAAMAALAGYAFPGNVRELENVLERALALAEGDSIDAPDLHLPQSLPARAGAGTEATGPAPTAQAEAVLDIEPGTGALPSYIEQLERAAIQKALEENRWNKTRTAAQLGITFRALRYKLKKLGMD
jgi:two-component system response regulator PilR (NtrC family)